MQSPNLIRWHVMAAIDSSSISNIPQFLWATVSTIFALRLQKLYIDQTYEHIELKNI